MVAADDGCTQIYEKLGYQWATSLLAFLTIVMMPFPYVALA